MDIYHRNLNGEEIVGMFHKKELKKTNQTEFRVKKVTKRKIEKWEDMSICQMERLIIPLIVGRIKKT